ncbi:MAG: hypothetical protein RhofKO_36190 [Rhodothermales bacterium]
MQLIPWALAIGLGLIGLLFVPKTITPTLTLPVQLMPSQEWHLIRSEDGTVQSVLHDALRGITPSFAVQGFERGDVMRFALAETLQPGDAVQPGDTVARVYSNETELQLVRLRGSLAALKASLDVAEAGAKPSEVEEAILAVKRAEERLNEHLRTLERLRTLHERQLISDQDLEVAEAQRAVFEAEVEIARAAQLTAETGVKPEEIAAIVARTEALQREAETLRERQRRYVITAPIGGTVARNAASDTLLTLRNASPMLFTMPLPWAERSALSEEMTLTISLTGDTTSYSATLLDLGSETRLIADQPMTLALGRVDDRIAAMPGLLGEATITLAAVPTWAYMRHWFETGG